MNKKLAKGVLMGMVILIFLSCGGNSKTIKPWYRVEFIPLCDPTLRTDRAFAKYKEFGTYNPINPSKTEYPEKDSTIISFDFVADCCLKFNGDVSIKKDELILRYYQQHDSIGPCDCYCDYRMVYHINSKNIPHQRFRVIHVKQ